MICADCDRPLRRPEHGIGWLRCHSGHYWSEHAPSLKDRRGFAQLGGGQLQERRSGWSAVVQYLYRPAAPGTFLG